MCCFAGQKRCAVLQAALSRYEVASGDASGERLRRVRSCHDDTNRENDVPLPASYCELDSQPPSLLGSAVRHTAVPTSAVTQLANQPPITHLNRQTKTKRRKGQNLGLKPRCANHAKLL